MALTDPSGAPAWPPYDIDMVAADARQHDPGLPPETADLMARQAYAVLGELGELDAPAIARRLLSDNPDAGASAATVIAAAAVRHVEFREG